MEFDSLKTYLVERFLEWAYEQRSLHLPHARPLSGEERSRLNGYFEKKILDLTRIVSLDRISNPGFYRELTKSGIPIPLDLTQAAGFALIDYVLIRKGLFSVPLMAISTIFHEMVHVVQVDILGPRKLIELYVDSLLRDEYRNVPFERQAYDLTDRFVQGGPPFPVRAIVEEEFGGGVPG
ncbi:MAG: hypothetical protein ABID54_06705 [Pseudomonadota bacterium]